MATIKLDFKGVPLIVEFDYEREEPQTNDSPGYPETAAIENIFIGKVDVSTLFNQVQILELEKAILKELKS
jgi:hypothetical protein